MLQTAAIATHPVQKIMFVTACSRKYPQSASVAHFCPSSTARLSYGYSLGACSATHSRLKSTRDPLINSGSLASKQHVTAGASDACSGVVPLQGVQQRRLSADSRRALWRACPPTRRSCTAQRRSPIRLTWPPAPATARSAPAQAIMRLLSVICCATGECVKTSKHTHFKQSLQCIVEEACDKLLDFRTRSALLARVTLVTRSNLSRQGSGVAVPSSHISSSSSANCSTLTAHGRRTVHAKGQNHASFDQRAAHCIADCRQALRQRTGVLGGSRSGTGPPPPPLSGSADLGAAMRRARPARGPSREDTIVTGSWPSVAGCLARCCRSVVPPKEQQPNEPDHRSCRSRQRTHRPVMLAHCPFDVPNTDATSEI